MLALEDRLLLGQLRHGSRDALRRIYEKYRIELFTIAVSLLGDKDLAEDCLQDVFVRLAESGGGIRIGSNLKGYLASSMVNRARDQIRRQARCIGCSVDDLGCCAVEPSPAQRLTENEQAATLLNAVTQLPSEQREVFVLHAQAGLGFREIARIQDTPLRTAHSRYRYAIEKLRELLGEENEP